MRIFRHREALNYFSGFLPNEPLGRSQTNRRTSARKLAPGAQATARTQAQAHGTHFDTRPPKTRSANADRRRSGTPRRQDDSRTSPCADRKPPKSHRPGCTRRACKGPSRSHNPPSTEPPSQSSHRLVENTHLASVAGQAREAFLAVALAGDVVAGFRKGTQVVAEAGLAVRAQRVPEVARFAPLALESLGVALAGQALPGSGVARAAVAVATLASVPGDGRVAEVAVVATEKSETCTPRSYAQTHLHLAMIAGVSFGALRANVSLVLLLHLHARIIQLTARTEIVFLHRERTRAPLAVPRGTPQRIPVVPGRAPFALLSDGVVLAEALARVGIANFRVPVAVALQAEPLPVVVGAVDAQPDVSVGAGLARQSRVAGRTRALLDGTVALRFFALAAEQGDLLEGALDLVGVEGGSQEQVLDVGEDAEELPASHRVTCDD